MKKVLTFLLVISFSITAKEYKVFFLGGQSNMAGFGFVNELPDSLNKKLDGIYIFHGNIADDNSPVDGKGIWSQLQPGHGQGFKHIDGKNVYSDRFGLELTFGLTLNNLFPKDNIALIKYCKGGTSLDKIAPSYGTWDPDYNDSTGFNQYDNFLATLNNAFSDNDIDGDGEVDKLVPSGIIWMQGESDAYVKDSAPLYFENLSTLAKLIRAAFRNNDLPIVIGKIADSGIKYNKQKVHIALEIVQTAQDLFVLTDKNAALVNSTLSYDFLDRFHYNTEGYIDLGKQFAYSVYNLIIK